MNMENKYNKKLVISRLKELMGLFPEHISILGDLINRVEDEEYSDGLDNEIKNTIFNQVFSSIIRYESSGEIQKEINKLFCYTLKLFELEKKIFYNDFTDEYRIIPFSLDDSHDMAVNEKFKETTYDLIDTLFSNDSEMKEIIRSKFRDVKFRLDIFTNKLKECNLLPYYGTINFMMERMRFILSSIEEILLSNRVSEKIKENFIQPHNAIVDLLKELEEDFNYSEDNKDRYLSVESTYKKVMNIENEISIYMQPIWEDYLTDISSFENGGEFRFLIHCVSEKHVEEEKLNKVCTALITNNCPSFPEYGDYGYIMDISMDQISTMAEEDCGSWVMTKDNFIERGLPLARQMAEEIEKGKYIWYEYPKLSKLILPWNMETQMINNNKRMYGTTFGSEARAYSEVVMKKNDKPLKVLGYFYKNENGKKKVEEMLRNEQTGKPVIDFTYLYNLGNVNTI